jgi:hypothetical protein
MKRKSTNRESDDDDSPNNEQEIEEEVPPVQHPPQGGQPGESIHYGMLEVCRTMTPHYVVGVNYKAKGMTDRAKE